MPLNMPRVLIQFAHPAFSRSRVQKALVKYCRDIPGVTFNDLYDHYPDLYIDVEREKELLLQHDIIVLQHPFYWYSAPAIIKQWLDLVLEYNWAYGPAGIALTGKKMFSALSSGSKKESYGITGLHHFPVSDFLLPFRQTALLCHMEYLPPFIVHDTHHLEPLALDLYGKRYAALLRAFVGGAFNESDYKTVSYLNDLPIPPVYQQTIK